MCLADPDRKPYSSDNAGSPFVLSFFVPSSQNDKRQDSTGYVSGSGSTTDSCTDAIVYTLLNGQLFANSETGVEQFSADPGIPYSIFTPSSTPDPGSITTTFSVDSQGDLYWNNATFSNYQAQWCVLSNSSILAVFLENAGPPGCLYVLLSTNRCLYQEPSDLRSG